VNNSSTVNLIKVKSCSELLHMIQVCFCRYLKSVLSYKFLILVTCYPYSIYLCEQGCEDPWLFFKVKRGLQAQKMLTDSGLVIFHMCQFRVAHFIAMVCNLLQC